ncbi:MAG: arylamine N-acetyltransferase [Caldilineaceae bacterium]|nr:arylamine N-acetyltransferase [Caldilineaceae bacterium]
MQLEAYLARIQYAGPRTVTHETLWQLHRAHLLAIPYENLDIHLGRRLQLDLPMIYQKIVEEGRGGWCYEMNGLFAWALQELGFSVTLLGSTVGAPARGGNGDQDHLLLQIELYWPWLADVGFGNGIIEPLPLAPGYYRQSFLDYRLEQQGEQWYFHNHPHGGAGYGFTLQPRQLASFAERCHELQTLPDSGFVRTTVCHRFTNDGFITLRGTVLKFYTEAGIIEEELTTKRRYQQVLHELFGLEPQLADLLWDSVAERHRLWRANQA